MTETKKVETCGHINKHNWNYKEELGKSVLEDLACDLPAGHVGDHSAEKYEVIFQNNGNAGEGMKRVYWNDAAGTPADQIEEDLSTLPEDLQRAMEERAKEQKNRVSIVFQ